MLWEEILNSDLPLIITEVELQKKDSTRVSIFINKVFAFGISYLTYEEFHIHKNQELSREKLKEILAFEDFAKAKNEAVNYIAKKMRTEWEIHSRLLKKGYDRTVIFKILEEFRQKKYVDDADYAEVYVRDFINFKKDGVFKLRKKLQEKHVKNEFIENAISKYIKPDDQLEQAKKLAGRKLLLIQDKDKKKEKIYRFLAQKGFESSIVSQVLSDMFNNG